YVMPYVKGESLRARLTKEKQLPVEDAVQITREIAGALAYAHERGVIHRDVKPANIMLEEGHAVLADFGVAHAVAEAKDDRLTRTGTSLGTPAYMSPEQATGEQDLDGRSDQYALGCVLYEMLAGHPPFTGAQVEAVIRQHLTADAPSVAQARPSVPGEVAMVINRALSKSPADRFRTTGEMAAALALTTTPVKARSRWGRTKAVVYAGTVVLGLATAAVIASRWAGGGIDPSLHRVVVMPLENRTGDPSLDAYGNWAADHITSGLVDAQLTKVVPFQDVAAIADQTVAQGATSPGLGHDWSEKFAATLAVRGSFYSLPPGDSIEFRLQVVDSEGAVRGTMTPVRGATEDPNEALRTLQVQVVGTVAGIVVPDHQLATLAGGRRPPKLEAFQALVEGWTTFASSYEAAIPILKRAIELDPEYFRPLVVLRAAYGNLDRYVEADSLCQIIEERIDQADAVGRLEAELFCPNTSVEHRAGVDIARDLAKLMPGHDYLLGLTLLNVNRPREAAEAFERGDTAR
ncbi:MAG: serine/threonine protein kinase, partial [Longimicrobiales bacterium]|nr:serine/threonine protein kinase [Longimicrobiales bacterium]